MKGGFNDPLLQKYKNSSVLNRLMRHDNTSGKDWKKVEEKLRGQDDDTLDKTQKMRVYSTFIDELADNDGYLCKILDQNLIKMITKMKNYEIFNDQLNESYNDEGMKYKYDFTEDVRESNKNIPSKNYNKNMRLTIL
jgi:hypothetical protein